jgi:PAS domain S-box-containing protein
MTTRTAIRPTGIERPFGADEIIVTKTDLKGRITYANQIFCRLAEYSEKELLGQPHSMIRHPDMPRVVFKLLWDAIQDSREIFAYVVNISRTGGHYWVFAHVTPSFDAQGKIVGYHSNRRKPTSAQVERMAGIYAKLRAIENSASDRKVGLQSSYAFLMEMLKTHGVGYDEFIFAV